MLNRKVLIILIGCICLGGFGIFIVMDGLQDGINHDSDKKASTAPIVEKIPKDDEDGDEGEELQENAYTGDLETMIQNYLLDQGIDEREVAICYQNLVTNEVYELNADEYFLSGSIYKVPLAMLYYEQINAGEIDERASLLYTANSYEEGGPVGYTYSVGSYVPLPTLLYHTIISSDNTAARILFNHLGGWETYRDMIKKYDEEDTDSEEFYENEFTAHYTNEVLYYLYNHADEYTELIENMKLTCMDSYLNQNLEISIAQKYGSYDYAENAIGIVFGDTPYIISIFTSLSYGDGIQVVGDLNELCYNYTNS